MAMFAEIESIMTDRQRQQIELARRYHQILPGSEAESELVERYLPTVKTVVGRLTINLPNHVDVESLHSAGLVGLLNAVRNYDPQAGSTFDSYVRVRIRGAVFDELRKLDWVPRSVHDKARKVQSAIQALEQEKGVVPSNAEVAAAMKMSLHDYEELLDEIRPAAFVSLDVAQGEDSYEEGSRHESVADEGQEDPSDVAARRELARVIAERIDELPEMQRKVLALYYYEDLRLREIAEVFGVTESRVCQIHAQAILSIKSHLRRCGAVSL